MDRDTDIGGPQHRFPVTSHSAIIAARSNDQRQRDRALDTIVASYWKPAYKYIRIKWQASNEDAKDYRHYVWLGRRSIAGISHAHFAVGGYYFAIMLPGSMVGLIVGFATQKYGRVPKAAHS